MNGVKKHYIINLSSNNNYFQVTGMQGDGYGVRYAELEIIENGQQYVLDPTEVDVSIMGTKPDTHEIWNTCTITSEGYILVELTQQMLAVPGKGEYVIAITHKLQNRQLKSFPFFVMTIAAPVDPNYIESTDEFQKLLAVIGDSSRSKEASAASAAAAAVSERNAKTSENEAKSAKTAAESAKNAAVTAKNNAETAQQKSEAFATHPPHIGDNGNWFIWNTTTSAYVDSGIDASIDVNIADISLLAPNATPYVTNTGTDTHPVFHLFIPKAKQITSLAKIKTEGLVDSYRFTFSDDTTFDYLVTNGKSAYQAAVENGFTGTEAQFNTLMSDIVHLHDETVEAASSASTSAENAAESESNADTYSMEAYTYSQAAESYTKGGTGSRTGEDTDNAKYYMEQAKAVAQLDYMDNTTLGIGKPDGVTATATNGTFTVNGVAIYCTINSSGTEYGSDWLKFGDNVITPNNKQMYLVYIDDAPSLWTWNGTEYVMVSAKGGGLTAIFQSDFNALPQEEKDNPDIWWWINDASGSIASGLAQGYTEIANEAGGTTVVISKITGSEDGIWTPPIVCAIGDESVTISNSNIHTTSSIMIFFETESGFPVTYSRTQTSEGQLIITFSAALQESTRIKLHIFN